MKFENVTAMTREAVAQTMGTDYEITVGVKDDPENPGQKIPDRQKVGDADFAKLDSSKLVDIGRDITEGTQVGVDAYVKSLLTQMGKMIVDAKRYQAELPSLFVDNFEWGGYIERVYFSPQALIDDDMYNLVDGKSYDDHVFYKPQVAAKIYQEAKTITCPISIVRDQLKMAFQSWDAMNSFLSGIYTNVQNTIELAMEAYAHALISVGITAASANGKTKHEVKLLTEYKALHSSAASLTPVQALEDEDFMRYALKRISEHKGYFKRYTTAFNNGAIPTFTNGSDIELALLQAFASAAKFGVRANTYNEKLIGIGDYDEVAAWQAFKTDTTTFDFATDAAVDVALSKDDRYDWLQSASGAADSFKVENVVAVLYDHRTMGLCPHRSKVTTSYTGVADFWNEYYHELVNYILDLNYNLVIFTLN